MNMSSDHRHPAETLDPEVESGRDVLDDMQRADAFESALAEMTDRWMRSEAEIANVRARAKRDVADARQFAVQDFATDVVEAAENLHRGLERLPAASVQEPESMAGIRTGLTEIERSFIGMLERNGVKRDDPLGSAFDPNLHQAMAEQDGAPDVKPGTILQTLTPAWTLNGRLLRPAMVIVAKAEPAGTASRPPHHDAPR